MRGHQPNTAKMRYGLPAKKKKKAGEAMAMRAAGHGGTFEADEAVDAAEQQRVVGAEQLEVLDWRRGAGAGGGGVRRRGDDGGDVVARVGRHDRAGGERPVRAFRAALGGVLDHHRRHLRGLAVAHCSVSVSSAKLWWAAAGGYRAGGELNEVLKVWLVGVVFHRGASSTQARWPTSHGSSSSCPARRVASLLLYSGHT